MLHIVKNLESAASTSNSEGAGMTRNSRNKLEKRDISKLTLAQLEVRSVYIGESSVGDNGRMLVCSFVLSLSW